MKKIELSANELQTHNVSRTADLAPWSEVVWATPSGYGTFLAQTGAVAPDSQGLLGLRHSEDGESWEFEFIEDTYRDRFQVEALLIIKINGAVVSSRDLFSLQDVCWATERRDEVSNLWRMLTCCRHREGLIVATFDRIVLETDMQHSTRRYWGDPERKRLLADWLESSAPSTENADH